MKYVGLLRRIKAWLSEEQPIGWDHQTESPIYRDPNGPEARAFRRSRQPPSREIEAPPRLAPLKNDRR